MKMLLLFDMEGVIHLTKLRDGGDVIYISWDVMLLIVGVFGDYTAANREVGMEG